MMREELRGWWRGVVCALLFTAVPISRGAPPAAYVRPVTTIDFHGQRTVDGEALRKALPIHEGDLVSSGDGGRLTSEAAKSLSVLPHVRDARVALICCAPDGGVHLFVGVLEDTSPQLHFRGAPDGRPRLPEALVTLDAALGAALMNAVLNGHAAEDDSQGHAFLTHAPEARALQEQCVPLAAQNLRILRKVLRDSADAQQRAMAARFLGYAPDLGDVTDDLARAMTDPDPAVRNDAMRSLVVFSRAKNPPHIPYGPFVDLLGSPDWTDLNKASAALESLSELRDPDLLDLLRRRSMPALAAMARWHSREHAAAAYELLGRIGGLSEVKIESHLAGGDPEPVIAAALKRVPD